MSRTHIARITQDEGGRVHIAWGDGALRRAPGLQDEATVELRQGARPLAGLGPLGGLADEDLSRLGRHLCRALTPPEVASGDVIELRIEPAGARALPWHLLRDEVGPLLARGLRLTVHPARHRAQVPLSLHIHVLVVDTRPTVPEVSSRDTWESILGPLLGQHLRVDEEDAAPPPSLGPLDVLHVLVEGVTPERQARLLGGRDWEDLLTQCRNQPPRMLILEGAGPPEPGLARLCAELAEVVPCVVLACAAAPTDAEITSFSVGPRLLATMLESQLSPADAARLLEARERRSPARDLWVWGGTLPPRPDRATEIGRWYFDEGWRLSLDRTTQTDLAVGAIRRAARERTRQGARPAGVVLLWHGPAHSGLARFRDRLQWQLEHEEQPAIATELVALRWPEEPTEQDLAAQYASFFGHSPTREPGAARDQLTQSIASHVDQQLAGRRATRQAPSVLIVHHGELCTARDGDRLGAELLTRYARWWAAAFVPAVPDHITPVLALTLSTRPGDPLPAEIEAALNAADDLRPVEAVVLPSLPDILPRDIVNHIERFDLMSPSSLEERRAVAEEIVARTGGRYEPTIQLVEQIPWAKASFLEASRRRKKKI